MSGISCEQADWKQVIQAASPDVVGHAVSMALAGPVPTSIQTMQSTKPITRLSPQQQSSAIQMMIAELEKEGMTREAIRKGAFVRQLDPYRMSPQEVHALVHWSGQQYPQVLARIAAHFQDQPEVLEGLLGENVVRTVANSLGGATPRTPLQPNDPSNKIH